MSPQKPHDEKSQGPRFRLFLRADMEDYFTVAGPDGSSLALRPLREEEAQHVADVLNRYVDQ